MISRFYQNYSGFLIAGVLLTLGPASYLAGTITDNNDIETWLPQESKARAEYEGFRHTFGADECVVVGFQSKRIAAAEAEALCRRMERLKGISRCMSAERLTSVMTDLKVPEKEISARLTNLVQSKDGSFKALLLVLDEWGVKHRSDVVGAVRHQIDYCQIKQDDVALAGSPVVVTELDRLGSRQNNTLFFVVTMAICLVLLQFSVRNWKLSLSIVGLTLWAIQVTVALLNLAGSEMNFILSALPVLVMVFTLAVSIHFLHHFQSEYGSDDPLQAALSAVWKPSFLATLTTVIGLVSLVVSSISPVRMFGIAAAVGSVISLITGLGLLPAALVLLKYQPPEQSRRQLSIYRVALALVQHARAVTVGVVTLVIVCGIGLPWLSSKIDPIEFLPDDARVLHDVRQIENNLTKSQSIELVVDFGVTDMAFLDRLTEVQRVQSIVASHPAVGHTMSLASFLPQDLANGAMPSASLIAQQQSQHDSSSFVADADRKWRISARIAPDAPQTTSEVVAAIKIMTQDAHVTVTGLTPVLEKAQADIFSGFWESFAAAFLLISGVMFLALRSVKAGLLAMIPNLTPICIVFGVLGWVGIPVDIGTMMTASIALGLAVDGTFHFLFAHHRMSLEHSDPVKSTHLALCKTGMPILSAAVISAVGMLALTLSNFKPTVKFGYLMCTLLLTALLGDLILLPAILALKRSRNRKLNKKPHFQTSESRKRSTAPAV